MDNNLLSIIFENPAVDKFISKTGRLVVQDNLSLSYLLSASFLKSNKNISVVLDNLYSAQTVYEQISSIIGEDNCLLFPMDEIFHETNMSYSKEMLAQRLYVMNKCFDGKKRILITHLNAATRYLPDPNIYQKYTLTLEVGKSYSIQNLVKTLTEMSFLRVNKIDQSLQFALRGDILDIFPINSEYPIRIEFFDDEIESIRYFELSTQQSKQEIKNISIFPSTDLLISKEEYEEGRKYLIDKLLKDKILLSMDKRESLTSKVYKDLDDIEEGFNENHYRYFHSFSKSEFTIFDYFKSDYIVLYSSDDLEQSFEHRETELNDYIKEMFNNGLSLKLDHINYPFYNILNKNNVIKTYPYFLNEEDYYLDIKTIPFFSRDLMRSINMIKEYQESNYKVVVCLSEKYEKTYKQFLEDNEISFEELKKDEIPSSNLGICLYDLENGFELVREKIVFLGKREIYGYKQDLTVFSSRFKKAIEISSFEELQLGDYIVHEENGIGRYEGVITLEANSQLGDYLKIMYANEQILYVPLQKFSTIRKYVSREGAVPRLSRIGGKDWSNTKQKIKEKVNFLAERLIELYAQRETTPGFAFMKDDEFQDDFERAFPYPLTIDQQKAINEIKEDMEKPYPMDRLLCGDVGFGKTEVAFRAAFKAINSGKQVALLCPTTILAKQHYDVAKSRFAMFGINIALFSRFITEKKQQEYIEQIKAGKIHLIIGTHRLLSSEISIPNLGLLIVDEEQRFGVEHKERIKEMSVNVDVLSLSATPIPRTLQMSLLGIRNLSQLQTPPHARMPIQTYVVPYNFRLAKEAIARELSRGGQIYYLHNRVTSIYQKATQIKNALPKARVGVVHAKMDKNDIDDIMTKFYTGEIDVLVCTSIVEAGLDVPNANTMIVENADLFGLSQLYQIKGRVGRSNRVAYAYLFYNEHKELNPNADKRLSAIKEFTELGSGFRIAQKDLNIRGAGDILGSEQSGFIDTVGMDMYVSILNEVIQEKRGIVKQEEKIKCTNITVGGYIPSSYALDSDKIQLYQEIEACNTISSLEIFHRKIRDIYGRLPKEVEKILLKRKIDILSSSKNIESIFEEENAIVITLEKSLCLQNGFATKFSNKLANVVEHLRVVFINKRFVVRIIKSKQTLEILLYILETIRSFDL